MFTWPRALLAHYARSPMMFCLIPHNRQELNQPLIALGLKLQHTTLQPGSLQLITRCVICSSMQCPSICILFVRNVGCDLFVLQALPDELQVCFQPPPACIRQIVATHSRTLTIFTTNLQAQLTFDALLLLAETVTWLQSSFWKQLRAAWAWREQQTALLSKVSTF